MSRREFTLADGQLGTTAAAIVSGADLVTNRVDLLFSNVSDASQTVTLTVQVGGGTARRLRRAVLGTNDQLEITGLALQAGDTLLASASDASAVDYVAFSSGDGGLTMNVHTATGSAKRSMSGTLTVDGSVDVGDSPSVEELLAENNSLLRRQLLAWKILIGQDIPDPV